jgi:hypothetical protein
MINDYIAIARLLLDGVTTLNGNTMHIPEHVERRRSVPDPGGAIKTYLEQRRYGLRLESDRRKA